MASCRGRGFPRADVVLEIACLIRQPQKRGMHKEHAQDPVVNFPNQVVRISITSEILVGPKCTHTAASTLQYNLTKNSIFKAE